MSTSLHIVICNHHLHAYPYVIIRHTRNSSEQQAQALGRPKMTAIDPARSIPVTDVLIFTQEQEEKLQKKKRK